MQTEPAKETPLLPLTTMQKGIVGLSNLSMGVGMTINFVVVTPLARSAGLSEVQVACIMVISSAIYALMIPKWGEWANRFGRKRVMVFSLFAMGGTNMAFLFALDAALTGVLTGTSMLFTLMFVRIWFGLLAPGLQPASMAALTDATTSKDRAAGLGMLGAAMSVGSVIGPAGAAILAPFGALTPLWGSILLSIACSMLIGFALPATRKAQRSSSRPKPIAMRDPRVLPHFTFLFIYFIGVAIIQQTLGWFIEDRYALAEDQTVLFTGTAFACLASMMVIVQFGYIQPQKPDPRKSLPIGLGLIAIGYFAVTLVTPFWGLCLAFLIIGGGAALTVPSANAIGSLAVARHEQASAAALLAAAPPAAFIFGPLIGAFLYQASMQLPFLLSSVVMAVLAAYAFSRIDREIKAG
ncbi:MAG: MFS transporter [Hyphomonadaceae bacterium]|nr:MFS transporter [Hyphomonadaceae bacterium]OUX94041.1 MAG: MFS transporter [Hyphomonas sp. TMED17]